MTWLAGLLTAGVLLSAGAAADEPVRLQGDPLPAPSGLRLLVADDPPFVLDVDSGRSTRVRGLTELGNVSVTSVAGISGVVLAGAGVFAVRGRSARVTSLGAARDVVPAADSRFVWLKTGAGPSCMLRQVRLGGAPTGVRSRIPCGWLVEPGARRESSRGGRRSSIQPRAACSTGRGGESSLPPGGRSCWRGRDGASPSWISRHGLSGN